MFGMGQPMQQQLQVPQAQTLRPTTAGAGPQQMQVMPQPAWAQRMSAQPALNFQMPPMPQLGAGQSGVLAEQQALAQKLREEGRAEVLKRKQAADAAAAAQAMPQGPPGAYFDEQSQSWLMSPGGRRGSDHSDE